VVYSLLTLEYSVAKYKRPRHTFILRGLFFLHVGFGVCAAM